MLRQVRVEATEILWLALAVTGLSLASVGVAVALVIV